jgi:hypothetical protein
LSLADALDEVAFEELRVKVGTRVEEWLKQAADGIAGDCES